MKPTAGFWLWLGAGAALALGFVAAARFWEANPPLTPSSFDGGDGVRYRLLRFGSLVVLPQAAVWCWIAAAYVWRARRQ